jgi:transcriptional regulator with XRE-family HTH domain
MSDVRDDGAVTTLERRMDRAGRDAVDIRRRIGADIRQARMGAGVSIRRAAAAAGLSPSVYRRIERAESPGVTVDQLARACAAVGLVYRGNAYPAGRGIRDGRHGRLLEAFRARLPAGTPWHSEVGMPIPGDLRGWDRVTVLQGKRIAIEGEMRLLDAQAIDRRIALKRRDSGVELVILLLPDTNWNRGVLAADRELLRANFPLDTRAVLRAVGTGRAPSASGIVVL